MYCPVCLHNTLVVDHKGVISFVANNVNKSDCKFLYNLQKEKLEEIFNTAYQKIFDYIQWYSKMENKKPITQFRMFSNSLSCERGCALGAKYQSAIGTILPAAEVHRMLTHICNLNHVDFRVAIEDLS